MIMWVSKFYMDIYMTRVRY